MDILREPVGVAMNVWEGFIGQGYRGLMPAMRELWAPSVRLVSGPCLT